MAQVCHVVLFLHRASVKTNGHYGLHDACSAVQCAHENVELSCVCAHAWVPAIMAALRGCGAQVRSATLATRLMKKLWDFAFLYRLRRFLSCSL
jgi:hypothetical protein